jgi:hypothetical protein
VDRHQRLAAHGVGRATEEDLHLVVVEPRRFLAQIAVCLVMEGAPVVIGEALGLVGRDLRALLAAAPAVDVRQVGEIGEALAEGRHRAVDEIMGQAIVAGVDVPEVALDELGGRPADVRSIASPLSDRAGTGTGSVRRASQLGAEPAIAASLRPARRCGKRR